MNALGRLLSVGSEWAGYATLVPTGGACKAARAAADEASEQLRRQGARQAAWQAAQQGNASESLPAPIRNSFRGVSYEEIKEPLIVYRLYGGKARQLGRWFMLQRPQGRLQATIDYAIRPEWGNTLERLVALCLPRGTRVFVEPAAPQGGLVGGGLQVFVPDEIQIRPEWVLFDVAFP
ncbi:hypothetical protein NW855_16540 [Synechococcus sp. RC10B2]|uniref:hypothetical protein n=1 Tax=Synechococcus sp. RC10B2 TaxID=2964530 RepID=UPI0039C675E6